MTIDDKFDALFDAINNDVDYSELEAVFDFAVGIYGKNEETLNNLHHWYCGGDFDWSDMVPSDNCPYYNAMHCECTECIYR